MARQPAVADRFYPGNPVSLEKEVRKLLKPYANNEKTKCFAVVSPHAGYLFSGAVAAETLSSVEIPETAIILGLNHHGRGAPVALSGDNWDMVTAEVPLNRSFYDLLLGDNSTFRVDDTAHRFEHSVEVQIPILLGLQPKLQIVPVVLSHLSFLECITVANILTEAIKNYPGDVLVIASSDMSHYESREVAARKDKLALAELTKRNAEGLYNTVHSQKISMCGVIPVTVAMLTANQLGASHTEIIRYTDSGAVSGDTNQVVGYAGAVIS